FPQATYELHGSPAFYDVYLTKVFPRIKRSHGDWARYFERMISFPKDKRDREPLNPLKDLVAKMRENLEHDRTFKNIYELTIFDSVRDCPEAADYRRANLEAFLEAAIEKGVNTVWIARDLGYRGGRRTGVPLTDDVHLECVSRLFGGLNVKRATLGPVVAERTAAVI